MPGLMIASPSYGLANRLRLMGSAMIMAEELGKEFRFIWEMDRDMRDTGWHDLFEPSPKIVEWRFDGVRGRLEKFFWRSPFAGPDRLHALGGLPGDRRPAHERLLEFVTHENTPYACVAQGSTKPCSTHAECSVEIDPLWKHVGIRGQFNYKLVAMSDDDYVRRMRAFYRALRPVAAVGALVDRLTDAFAAQPTIGVHCRQTDNTHFYGGPIPIAAYYAQMDRALERTPGARFFVATDTAESRQSLRRRYGRRILPHIVDDPGADPLLATRHSRIGQQAALADLVALSRTASIIGTVFSSFSYVPAVWGNVPLVETGKDLRVIPWT